MNCGGDAALVIGPLAYFHDSEALNVRSGDEVIVGVKFAAAARTVAPSFSWPPLVAFHLLRYVCM